MQPPTLIALPKYAVARILRVPRLLGRVSATPTGVGHRITNIAGIVLGFIAVVIAASAPVVFPVFRLPEPTGPYAVGSASFEWACAVDEASEQVTIGVWAELRFVAQDMVEGELPRALAGRSAVDTVT